MFQRSIQSLLFFTAIVLGSASARAMETNSAVVASTEASLLPAFGKALRGGMHVAGQAKLRLRPFTVECWARLDSAIRTNLLIACDPRGSAKHWALFTAAGSGALSFRQPGRNGALTSAANICDGKWHYLAAVVEAERAHLFVDGKLVQDAPVPLPKGKVIHGDLTFGQNNEGDVRCDGLIDEVRISFGPRAITGVSAAPFLNDPDTIGLWHFDGKPAADHWAVESAAEREKLPLYQTIPAAKPEELTPATGFPKRETYKTWQRSHGDNGGMRFSALTHINRQTITNLQMAWTYHSRDGSNNIQCNPIIANGVMFAPTAGKHIAAVNAETGVELWRSKPEGQPAFRGLIYWLGKRDASDRVMFCTGKYLYAFNPANSQPIAGFGENGHTLQPGVALGDFGFDTWAGMAMDEVRGIAYSSTGGPKPNFIGVDHWGENLFANCVVAIDARTGKYRWHFQEIRHDHWDLDISAPPTIGTITRDGKRVDIVAVCTKIGNTLQLDRVTGKPIFPFRLRRAPTSTLKGERSFPYQPDVELPEPFLKMEFTAADLTERNEEVADWARTQFLSTCPPLRGLRLRLTDEDVRKQIRTGKNGMPAQPVNVVSEPDLKALIDYLMVCDGFVKPRTTPPKRPTYSVSGAPKFCNLEGFPANKPPWGTINCIDLNTSKLVWRKPLGEDPRLVADGLRNTGTENYGGAIVTAGGLVFAAVTRDNKIRAFDKDIGAEPWSAQLPWTGSAPPASYEVNGRQYIVIAASGGNKLGTLYGDAYVAFALPTNKA